MVKSLATKKRMIVVFFCNLDAGWRKLYEPSDP